LTAAEFQAVVKDILRTTGEGIIGIDEHNIIYLANENLHRMWGYEPGELIGQPVQILQPRHYRRDHTNAVRRFHENNKPDTSGHWNEVEALHKQGHEFQVFIRIARVQHEGRFLLVAAVQAADAYWQARATAENALMQARSGSDAALIATLESLLDSINRLNPATETDMMRTGEDSNKED
jgi:PAS domain S-box-containing protein